MVVVFKTEFVVVFFKTEFVVVFLKSKRHRYCSLFLVMLFDIDFVIVVPEMNFHRGSKKNVTVVVMGKVNSWLRF